ncbi:hypothetical protein JCM17846_21630 [Iodidimonas nitroreducens]|uniref:Polysaccharide biosynthesis protein C-terminal domain-containing protein n=1 Tax=Iodidimonas nitroreducens TaxID=1236968 RepID=A0A5A7N825_9PROT|nr:hypothetical protein JCM17846_21630 [Iodidimonas nitroreducens]
MGMRLWLMGHLDDHFRDILSGAAITFGLKIMGMGLMFAFNVLVARLLGVANTGLFFLALTLLQMAATVALWGLDNATLRFISGFAAKERC